MLEQIRNLFQLYLLENSLHIFRAKKIYSRVERPDPRIVCALRKLEKKVYEREKEGEMKIKGSPGSHV